MFVITIIIEPVGPDMFASRHDGRLLVLASTEPFCAAARVLLAEGVDPGIDHRDAAPRLRSTIALRSTIGVAARLTVEDGPQWRAAVPPLACPVRVGRLAVHAFWRGGGARHSPGRRRALWRDRGGGAMKATPAPCRHLHHSQPGACPPPPRSPASGCRPRPRCHAARRNLASLVRAGPRVVGLVQRLDRAARRRGDPHRPPGRRGRRRHAVLQHPFPDLALPRFTQRRLTMADESKPELEDRSNRLDEEEAEFRALRCDLPGVTGAAAAGMLTIGVGRQPTPKNEFFRTQPRFSPARAPGDRPGRDGRDTTSRWRPA